MASADYVAAASGERTGRRRSASTSLAGFRQRCGAFLFDYILMLLVPALTLVLAVYIKRRWQSPFAANVAVAIGYAMTAGLAFVNFVYWTVLDGQSFGKRLIGIRVVRADGAPMDYPTALLRHFLGYPISILFFGLGLLWSLLDGRRQGWHDKIANTVVVKE